MKLLGSSLFSTSLCIFDFAPINCPACCCCDDNHQSEQKNKCILQQHMNEGRGARNNNSDDVRAVSLSSCGTREKMKGSRLRVADVH